MFENTGWNDKIVAQEKTTWFHFRLMKTGFLFFFFVAHHLLVVQLCRNPKSDRSLLSCLKVTQCSTTLPAPSECKSGLPRITGTCPGWWKQSFQLVSSEGHIMPPHILEVGLKVNTKVYLDVLKSVVMIPWCNQVADPGCGSRTRHRATSPKKPRLGFRRSATTLYPFSHWPPPPPTWTRWTPSFGHTSRTSPTWPPITLKPAWSPPSAEYSPSSRQCLWKRHAPSSRSVLRRWLRLKAATLNRCQLYYM